MMGACKGDDSWLSLLGRSGEWMVHTSLLIRKTGISCLYLANK